MASADSNSRRCRRRDCLHCFVDKDYRHDHYLVKLYQWRASATVIPMKMLERHAEIKRRAFIEQST